MAEKTCCTTNPNKMSSFVQNIVKENSPRRTCLESLDEDLGPAQCKRIKYDDLFSQENNCATPETEKSLISNDMISKLIKQPLKMNATIDLSTPGKENCILRRGVRALRLDSPNPNPLDSFKMPRPLQESSSPLSTKKQSKSAPYNCSKTSQSLMVLPPTFDLKPYDDENSGQTQVLTPNRKRLYGVVNKVLSPITKNIQEYANPKPQLSRSQSESAVTIMKAVERIDSDPMLIGDCSKRYSLPTINEGKNADLKQISTQTMAAVLLGEYNNEISGFEIVDCRYPFEFNGGHIEHAINLHTQKQVFERYLASKEPMKHGEDTANKFILIFHCEFSSKRGPDMCRFLRDADRKLNSVSYPLIHYPEIYLLCGGYKSFYESYQELCTPQTYVPMLAPEHDEEYRFHRNKSKSELFQTKSSSSLSSSSFKISRSKSFLKKLQL